MIVPQKRDPWMMVSLVLIGLVLGFVLGNVYGGGGSINLGSDGSAPTAKIVLGERTGGVNGVIGDENAPVTIEEYSDFQCPYCARFFNDTLPLLEKDYINTGKVKFLYKDFPIKKHPQAFPAAVATRCAGEQKNYWGMHDAVFLNVDMWASNPAAKDVFVKIAKELKLNKKAFETCLGSGKFDSEINASLAEGAQKGISGTPGFFINDQKIVGAQPYEVFQAIIEEELAK